MSVCITLNINEGQETDRHLDYDIQNKSEKYFLLYNFPFAKSTSGLAVDGDLHLMQDNMTRFCSEIQIYHYPRAAICVFGELFWDLLH